MKYCLHVKNSFGGFVLCTLIGLIPRLEPVTLQPQPDMLTIELKPFLELQFTNKPTVIVRLLCWFTFINEGKLNAIPCYTTGKQVPH